MTAFLEWLENTPLGLWVSESQWGYPIVLSAHAVGMAILAGVALMFSFRVLGWAKSVPVTSLSNYMKIAQAGFVINLLSGVALFAGSAAQHWDSWPFRIKIILIFVGLWLTTRLYNTCLRGDGSISERHKIIAALAVFAWVGALIGGRLIAYVDTGI